MPPAACRFVFRRGMAAALLALLLLPAAGGGEMRGEPVLFSMMFPQLTPDFGLLFRRWMQEIPDCAAPAMPRREVCL